MNQPHQWPFVVIWSVTMVLVSVILGVSLARRHLSPQQVAIKRYRPLPRNPYPSLAVVRWEVRRVIAARYEVEHRVAKELRLRLVGCPSGRIGELAHVLVTEAYRHGFDPWLMVAVIEAESEFRVTARSPTGARGLMQLIPSTFRSVSSHEDHYDPVENVRAGIKYFAYLHKSGKGFVRLESILRAYNAGPGGAMAYARAQKTGSNLSGFSAEMKAYPGRVMTRYRRLLEGSGGHHSADPNKRWRVP